MTASLTTLPETNLTDENRPLDPNEADALRAIVAAQENDAQSEGIIIGLSRFKTVASLDSILKNDQLVDYRKKGFNAKARALLEGKQEAPAQETTPASPSAEEKAVTAPAAAEQPKQPASRRASPPYRSVEGPY